MADERRPARVRLQVKQWAQRTVLRFKGFVHKVGAIEPSTGIASVMHVPRPLIMVALSLATFVAAAELFFVVEDTPLLLLMVILFDTLLVSGFSGWLALRLLRSAERPLVRLLEHRIDVLVAISSLLLLPVAPRVAGGIVIARIGFTALGVGLTTALGERAARLANLKPPQTLALSFIGLIALGTALLATPAASASGAGVPLVDALFTMSSAITITGLVVQDTGTFFSPFGKTIILLGFQTGAVGTMVLGAAFIVVVGGRLPGRQQQELSQLLQVNPGEGLRRLIAAVSATFLGAEAIGAALLYGLWAVGWMELPREYDEALLALWWCVFHAVSAFCNAGFALSADSLSRFVSDPFVNLVFIALITTGGLGFAVISDLSRRRPWLEKPRWSWSSLQMHTRVVLLATLVLNLFGALAFLFFEYEGVLAPYGIATKLNASVFQAVTLRSCGFNTVPTVGLAMPTVIVMLMWMFVGAGPGSTGGGVKTTTATVTVLAIRAMLRGRDDVELFGRALPQTVVYRSIAIVLVTGVIAAVFLVLLTATQDIAFVSLLFETISALATVGLSVGASAELDTTGKLLISALMYFGRIGPLTLALAVGSSPVVRTFRYPEGRMAVG
jgi:trk system potassium uptake protein